MTKVKLTKCYCYQDAQGQWIFAALWETMTTTHDCLDMRMDSTSFVV